MRSSSVTSRDVRITFSAHRRIACRQGGSSICFVPSSPTAFSLAGQMRHVGRSERLHGVTEYRVCRSSRSRSTRLRFGFLGFPQLAAPRPRNAPADTQIPSGLVDSPHPPARARACSSVNPSGLNASLNTPIGIWTRAPLGPVAEVEAPNAPRRNANDESPGVAFPISSVSQRSSVVRGLPSQSLR